MDRFKNTIFKLMILGAGAMSLPLVQQPASAAETLYGSTSGGASSLYSIDATTGTATLIGPIGFISVGGIDFAPDGTLYGVSGSTNELITIDPLTGVGSLVGPMGSLFNGRFDVSFRNSDGTLFATGFGSSCVGLATVNLITGLATEVGPTGTCNSGNGLAFSAADVLYHTDTSFGGPLYTLNQVTGMATAQPVSFTFSGFPLLEFPRINALEFHPTTDILYASVNDGFEGSGPNYLATVDPITGLVTHVGQTVNGLDAIAWLADFDSDGDGVLDDDDICPNTAIPEGVPTVILNPNHWALTDGDSEFDTVTKGKGKGPNRSYSTTDTAGCSCEQIIEAQGLGQGHTMHGCSIGVMDNWVKLVTP